MILIISSNEQNATLSLESMKLIGSEEWKYDYDCLICWRWVGEEGMDVKE